MGKGGLRGIAFAHIEWETPERSKIWAGRGEEGGILTYWKLSLVL